MATYIGGKKVAFRIGTKNVYQDAILVNDLSDYYTKPETYSKFQIDETLRNFKNITYTKGEIENIISSFNLPFRAKYLTQVSGDIQLYNETLNIVSISGDANFIMPRTVDGSTINRFFEILFVQNISSSNISFQGYQGQQIQIQSYSDSFDFSKISTYHIIGAELSSGEFLLNSAVVLPISGYNLNNIENGTYGAYLKNFDVNYLILTSDITLEFPPPISDDNGNRIMRCFELVVQQDTVSAYNISYRGPGGSELVLNSYRLLEPEEIYLSSKTNIIFSEISSEGNVFIVAQKQMKQIT